MSLQRIIIDTGSSNSAADFKSVCDLAPGQLPALQNFENYVGSVSGGNQSAQFKFQVGAVQATATIVSAATAVAAETMLLLNVTLTAKASGAVAANGEFNISATPATQAASIAAAINAVASLSGKVTAVVTSGGTVTVTSVVPGLVGNGLQISESLTGVTVTAFASGSDGTSYNIDLR